MRKLLYLLLAAALLLAACGAEPQKGSADTTAATTLDPFTQTDPGQVDPTGTAPESTVPETAPSHVPTGPASNYFLYFYLTFPRANGMQVTLESTEDLSENVEIRYSEKTTKLAYLPADELKELPKLLEKSKLLELSDTGDHADYPVQLTLGYSDETEHTVYFSKPLSAELMAGCELLENYFKELTKGTEDYVAKPRLDGDVDATLGNQVSELLIAAALQAPNDYVISQVTAVSPETIGLTPGTLMRAGILCTTHSPSPFWLLGIRADSEAAIADVRADFQKNLNWNRSLSGTSEAGLLAHKDLSVLCIMGSVKEMEALKPLLEAAGWQNIEALQPPTA